jgi:transglutaminase-like putative cysteine protease
MASSGQLPIWSLALFGGGLLLALLDRRILQAHGGLTAILLVVSAMGLGALLASHALDEVVAAGAFAGLVAVQRMLSQPTPAVDGQVHLTSLLMIAGGAALSGDIWFAVWLVLFAGLGCFSLGLGVLEQAAPEGADLPLRPLVRQLSAGSALAVVGAVVFFIAIPRLSWNVASRRGGGSLFGAVSGISDSVRLDGPGTIKRNPRMVARVQLEPDPGTETLDAYWVAHTFDTFDGSEWVGATVQPRPPLWEVHLGRYVQPLVYQQIELLPAYGARSLVGLDSPVLLANAMMHGPSGRSGRVALEEMPGQEVRFVEPGASYTYHAYSTAPDVARRTPEPTERSAYLTLPESLDPRVPALARQIAGDATDPLEAARRLQQYLRANYQYTLELTSVADPLADFLFQRRAGHCEHFATAMVVMLRALGHPARVAGGFYGGERVGTQYVLRAADAHAWSQVLVTGRGFISVDATPEEGRSGQPAAFLAFLTEQLERLEDLWRRSVVDYSMLDQVELARSLVRPPASADSAATQGWSPDLKALAASAAVALATYSILRRRRAARGPRVSREVGDAARFLDAIERRLRAARVRFRDGEQLEELAVRLSGSRHPLGAALDQATRRYLEARFGGRPLPPNERAVLLAALDRASAS